MNNLKKIETYYYTDTEALVKSFINPKYIKRYKLPLLELIKPVKLRLINSKIAGIISYIARTILVFEDYLEELYCLVISLAKFNIILGMPWLELHDPYILFKKRSYTFNSDYCISEYLKHYKLVTIYSPGKDKKSRFYLITKYRDIAEISVYIFIKLAKRKENQVIAI